MYVISCRCDNHVIPRRVHVWYTLYLHVCWLPLSLTSLLFPSSLPPSQVDPERLQRARWIEANERYVEGNTKPCPRCRVPVEKNGMWYWVCVCMCVWVHEILEDEGTCTCVHSADESPTACHRLPSLLWSTKFDHVSLKVGITYMIIHMYLCEDTCRQPSMLDCVHACVMYCTCTYEKAQKYT